MATKKAVPAKKKAAPAKKSAKKKTGGKRSKVVASTLPVPFTRALKPMKPESTVVIAIDKSLNLGSAGGPVTAKLAQPLPDLLTLTRGGPKHVVFDIEESQPTTLGVTSNVLPQVGQAALNVSAKVVKTVGPGGVTFTLVIS